MNKLNEFPKILYHGSYCVVEEPDLSKCNDGKDFGKGFYLTSDKKQAEKFAKRVAIKHKTSCGYVSIFEVVDIGDVLKIHEFVGTTEDWFKCVVGNRNFTCRNLAEKWKNMDVLIGKIADDHTDLVINAYFASAYGEVGSEIAMKTAIDNFLTAKLNDQFCFKTNKSLKVIRFVGSFKVDL